LAFARSVRALLSTSTLRKPSKNGSSAGRRLVPPRACRASETTARYKKWIAPVIGAQPIGTIPRRRIEDVVQSLDRSVQFGKLRWKTATNVWGVLSKMMKDASRSKVLALRIREDNPAREDQGPDLGVERAAPYLFPSEFLALMDCGRVPARWKRLIMLATYLYVRAGGLEALEWNAVDCEHGYVLIHQSAHSDTGVVKALTTWSQVVRRDYRPWDDVGLRIDTAQLSAEESVRAILTEIRG
jgi:hypothetical protein